MNQPKSFLGTGWGFPPTFAMEFDGLRMVSGLEDIEESLTILLSTRLKERVMQLKYGLNLDEMLFETLSTSFLAYMKDLIETAILFYEPRIDLEEVNMDKNQLNEGILDIELIYRVRATNSRHNMVYPFYVKEATDVSV
ncbi:MAG: GPW/gp25 family protein [Phaeodactylibacter sp.]|nr:GPW/gp25 family protein [Phaeodactylibacter sp.]MCB9304593.1 GPW/gp25 family protein [Lewinellaceae bacterium]